MKIIKFSKVSKILFIFWIGDYFPMFPELTVILNIVWNNNSYVYKMSFIWGTLNLWDELLSCLEVLSLPL